MPSYKYSVWVDSGDDRWERVYHGSDAGTAWVAQEFYGLFTETHVSKVEVRDA